MSTKPSYVNPDRIVKAIKGKTAEGVNSFKGEEHFPAGV